MKSTRYHNIYEDGATIFWTSSIVEWLPVLKSPKAAFVLLEVLEQCRARYNVRLHGWCVMPEHIHLIVSAEKGGQMESFVEQMLCRYSTRLAAMCEKAALSGNETAARWMDIFRANARGKSRVRVWKERAGQFRSRTSGVCWRSWTTFTTIP